MIYKVESMEKLREMLRDGVTITATESGHFVVFQVDEETTVTKSAPRFNKGDQIHIPPHRVQLA